MTIAVTGATGQLGRHVIANLKQMGLGPQTIALVRDEAKAADLGVATRPFDYDKAETLAASLQGIDKLLLISGNAVGKRLPQHTAVIAAAKEAGVGQIIYTSLLRADTSEIVLAKEHYPTEQAIIASGIPYVILRNGWYAENYTGALGNALAHGAVVGSAGNGKLSLAARADYAAAAAQVVATEGHEGKIYELAGDTAVTLADLAAEVSRQSGKPVVYSDIPEADYRRMLEGFGLPAPVAHMLATSDTAASRGALFDDSGTLSRLIGRPTTKLADVVAEALPRS